MKFVLHLHKDKYENIDFVEGSYGKRCCITNKATQFKDVNKKLNKLKSKFSTHKIKNPMLSQTQLPFSKN